MLCAELAALKVKEPLLPEIALLKIMFLPATNATVLLPVQLKPFVVKSLVAPVRGECHGARRGECRRSI